MITVMKGGVEMYVVAIAAVMAGGKTTVANELKRRFPTSQALHFDDYSFDGEVDDFHQWVQDGADYSVWNLEPLERDIIRIKDSGKCELLILDYPFAYCHPLINKYIDLAIFIDTPLDIALARRVLRDMTESTGQEIRSDLRFYLEYARIAYLQMLKDIKPSSDLVVDGALPLDVIVENITEKIRKGKVK